MTFQVWRCVKQVPRILGRSSLSQVSDTVLSRMVMTYAVSFNVRVHEDYNDVVGVVGSCPELGQWDYEKAILLQRHTKVASNEHSERDVWSEVVQLSGAGCIDYRFFIGRLLECDKDEKKFKLTVVQWETHFRPRSLTLNGPVTLPVVEFGMSDGEKRVTNGWLTGQTSMQLRIHGNPIKMWKSRYHGQTYRIKCIPMDYRPHNMAASDCDEDSREGPPLCPNTRTTFSVLDETNSIPRIQDEYGKVFNVDDYLVFNVQSFHPEHLGFQLEFYVHDPHNQSDAVPKYIGFAHLLPVNQQKSLSLRLRVPIMGLKHKPIGEVNVDSLIVKPHPRFHGKMDISYQNHWQMKGKTLDVGHRGMGMSYKNIALVKENTLASFSAAASHGADMVEFDVMLTKDHMPVVYHDYAVCLSYKKRADEQAELFIIPIKDLTLENLHSMKLSHTCSISGSHVELTEPCNGSDETQPFPTLKQVLLNVDSRLDFNLEVKHPLICESGMSEQENYFDHNLQVDKILETVFEYAGTRHIVFSSFDADTCIMLQLKQNRYPVLFLSNGPTARYEPYKDFRAKTFQAAICFAVSEGILGVDFQAEGVLQDMSVIKKSHDAGLIVFIWGEDANNKDTIKLLRQHGADGIIYDRIDFNRPQDEILFELDNNEQTMIQEISCVSLPDANYHRENDSRSIS